MTKPIAICLEDLHARAEDPRYLRCVALPGRVPGLRLDAQGRAIWQPDEPGPVLELWVSLDDQLILYRPAGAVPVQVRRGGRALDAPEGKPVVLLEGDELATGGRELRVHVHGATETAHAPELLAPLARESSPPARAASLATAALFVLGAAVGGCTKTVEVRDRPPSPPMPPPDTRVIQPDAGPTKVPIEVRENPPGAPAPIDPPPPPPAKPKP